MSQSVVAVEASSRKQLISKVVLVAGGLIALHPSVSSGVGLLMGAAIALTLGNPFSAITRKMTHWLILGAVVGLGAATNLRVVAQVGVPGLLQTALGIAGCLGLAFVLSKLFKVPTGPGILIGVGTAICGGSAIAAVAPILRSKDEEVSIALATVFVLNGIALFLFPAVGHAFGLDQHRFGVWSALAIHDTSSVVGAAMAYGREALEVATTLKLTRALWIVPVAFSLSLLINRGTPAAGAQKMPKPWFLVGFVVASALATWVPAFHSTGVVLSEVARRAMVLALFCVGTGLSKSALRAVGARPLVFGAVLWGIVGSLSLVAVMKGL